MDEAQPRRYSAGAVIFRRTSAQPLYLLLRAYRYWDFPKGEVEPGEDPLTAARREVLEETGLSELSFPWGEIFHETPPYRQGKIARYYLAEVPDRPIVLGVNAALGRPEHHEYRWLTHAQARPLLVPRVRDVLDWAQAIITGKNAR
jgi:bis(5'-nucleosidyl)-tetraphosphatase